MIGKCIMTILTGLVMLSVCSCGSNMITTEETVSEEMVMEEATDSETSEEDFDNRYDNLLTEIELLNTYSDYCGETHSIIWDSVGVDDVAKYIRYVRTYGTDPIIGYELVEAAYGISSFRSSDREKVEGYIEQYQKALEEIPKLREDLETQYRELNELYGTDYNISDLKEYYVESDAYAEYAINIDGSYITYNQRLNDYQSNIEKLKKAAEIAF